MQALGAFDTCMVFVQQPVQLMLQLLNNVGIAFLLLFLCKVWGNIYVLSTYCISKAISKSNTHSTSTSNAHSKYANGSPCWQSALQNMDSNTALSIATMHKHNFLQFKGPVRTIAGTENGRTIRMALVSNYIPPKPQPMPKPQPAPRPVASSG